MASLRNSLRWVSVCAGVLVSLALCLFGGSNGGVGGLSGDGFWRYFRVATSYSSGGDSSSARHRELSGQLGGEGRRARLAFLVLCSGKDVGRLQLLLPEIYHPDNIYLVHVDAKTPSHAVSTTRTVSAAVPCSCVFSVYSRYNYDIVSPPLLCNPSVYDMALATGWGSERYTW